MKAAILVGALLLAAPARADSLDGTTGAILVAVPIGLLAWDGYIGLDRTLHNASSRTESMILRDVAWQANVVPFACGAVAAHWFFNLSASRQEEHWRSGFLMVGAVAALDVALAVTRTGQDRPAYRHPALWFGLGLGAGTFAWAQRW